MTFLGFKFNSMDMTISVQEEKITKIILHLKKFLRWKKCTTREFVRLTGKLISICPAISTVIYIPNCFEREKNLALKSNKGNYNGTMKISKKLCVDTDWWIRNIPISKNLLSYSKYSMEIFSDASDIGWGVCCNNISSQGLWPTYE